MTPACKLPEATIRANLPAPSQPLVCEFCKRVFCDRCEGGRNTFLTGCCGETCKDAAEVVRALEYDGPRCVMCGARSDRPIGSQRYCSAECQNLRCAPPYVRPAP